MVETNGDQFDYDVARPFVEDAIKNGFIDESERSAFLKKAFFAVFSVLGHNENAEYSLKDAEDAFYDPENTFLTACTTEDYVHYSLYGLYKPFIATCFYVFQNHPLVFKRIAVNIGEAVGVKIDTSYCGLRKNELFDFFRSMTPYGLHNLLADIKCQFAEEVFDAVQSANYDAFKSICYEKNIDFTEVSEAAGYLLNTIGGVIKNEEIMDAGEEEPEDVEISYESVMNPIISMIGLPELKPGEFESLLMGKDVYEDILPFIKTDEEAQAISSFAYGIAAMYLYLEYMDERELAEINRLLDNPDFDAIIQLAQIYFCAQHKRIPEKVTIHLSQYIINELLADTKGTDTAETLEKVVVKDNVPLEQDGSEDETEVNHWPSDEELSSYKEIFNDQEYFSDSIFGVAGTAKVSDVEGLFNVLVSLKVLNNDLQTKLIFLERYTGKAIPGVTLKPIEWKMIGSDRDKAIGYLIEKTAGGKLKFAKGRTYFYYYNHRGEQLMPEREAIATGGKQWANPARLESSRTTFEKEINHFLRNYKELGED